MWMLQMSEPKSRDIPDEAARIMGKLATTPHKPHLDKPERKDGAGPDAQAKRPRGRPKKAV